MGRWRPEPESNRRTRLCRPLRNHSAIRPNARAIKHLDRILSMCNLSLYGEIANFFSGHACFSCVSRGGVFLPHVSNSLSISTAVATAITSAFAVARSRAGASGASVRGTQRSRDDPFEQPFEAGFAGSLVNETWGVRRA